MRLLFVVKTIFSFDYSAKMINYIFVSYLIFFFTFPKVSMKSNGKLHIVEGLL